MLKYMQEKKITIFKVIKVDYLILCKYIKFFYNLGTLFWERFSI